MVYCDSCNGSRSCSVCFGVGVTPGAGANVWCRQCLGTGKCAVCQSIRLSDLAELRDVRAPATVGWSLENASRASRYERGVVREDPEIHAVRKWIGGDQALCGAGAIARRLTGHFVPGDPGTCGDCGFHIGH